MAKIRAYKLAEELGIDRAEFVDKAAAVGVELKSAMTALEPIEADQLREKLGFARSQKDVVEERVENKAGTAVIRRRRKKVPDPEPEPVAVEPEAAPEVVEPARETEPEQEETGDEGAEPVVEPISEPFAPIAAAPTDAPRPGPGASAPGRPPGSPPAPAGAGAEAADRKGRQRKRVREVVNLKEQEQFARQVTTRTAPRRVQTVDPRQLSSPRRRRRDAPAKQAIVAPPKEQKRVVRVEGDISVGELAKQLGLKAAQVQGKLMALGIMVSVNQPVDVETCRKVATDLGYEVQDTGFKEAEFIEPTLEAGVDDPGNTPRPPVITVMGHVDHGKTSLLDALRKTDVVAGEAGGITQHIGAYQTKAGSSVLTFIDTPGHAAFTQMRARGAQATDIVVLVVAATDGVMPQTIEAIDHAKAAGVPIVVAVNKVDLPGADPQSARQRLMEHGLVAEDYGGDIICVDVSALKGTGLEQLLEMLSLQSELLELKADPSRRASGVVLEARLDKGRGPVATVLVQNGTLKRGDIIVAGMHYGRVRFMENDRGEQLKEAGPSMPVQVIGLGGVPDAGAPANAVENERAAKQIVEHREGLERRKPAEARPKLTLEEIFAQAEEGGLKELPVVLKADVHGTLEAVKDSLEKLSTDRVTLNVISAGVGGITENDVMLAGTSHGIVVGFHVRPDPAARRASDGQGVDIRVYKIIMELLDDVKAAMAGLLPPTVSENLLGVAEVRETFTIPKIGTICGSYINEGLVRRNAPCRLIRDGVQLYEGRVGSLKRFKDDAREVQTGFECGIGIDGYNDIKVGDSIEVFELIEKPAEL